MRKAVFLIWVIAGILMMHFKPFEVCAFPWYVDALISLAICAFFMVLLAAVGPENRFK